MNITEITTLTERISLNCMDKQVHIMVDYDKVALAAINPVESPHPPRVYLQLAAMIRDVETGHMGEVTGRKWYLSEYMLPDEVIKTVWLAFEVYVRHEALEGFKLDGKALFNPHGDTLDLLTANIRTVKRPEL